MTDETLIALDVARAGVKNWDGLDTSVQELLLDDAERGVRETFDALTRAGYRIIGPEDEERIRTLAHTDHSWHGLNDPDDWSKGYWVSPGKFLALLQGDET